MNYYVDSGGKYKGGTDAVPPEDWIPVTPPPEYSDQVWQFPGWSESRDKLSDIENEWREEQMLEVADQLLKIDDDDHNAKPGTARQWRDYRIQLRSWTDTSPDFPDSSKRPIAPT